MKENILHIKEAKDIEEVARIMDTAFVLRLKRGNTSVWLAKLDRVTYTDLKGKTKRAVGKSLNPNDAIRKLCEKVSHQILTRNKIVKFGYVGKGDFYVRSENSV